LNEKSTKRRPYGGHGTFNDRLADGASAEREVARWLKARGHRVTILANGGPGRRGAPLRHGLDDAATAPDLMVVHAPSGRARLLEVKSKSCATWHVLTRCWTSGITEAELRRYQHAEALTGLPCWLAFVQRGKGDRVVEKAPSPPAGLYVAPVTGLEGHVNHAFGAGRDRRLYWRLDRAPWCRLAPLDEFDPPADGAAR
jgi:hypothetical protein